jgi:phage FluMu protein gp41
MEAIGAAYQRLELVLLDRAFNGTERIVKRKDGSEERMLEYSNQLGLTLLKMHRDTAIEAGTEFQPQQIEELRERVLNKLQRLKQRHEQDKAEEA